MWTHFYDMHSGGGTKEEPYQHIFIEADEDQAKIIFYNRFGHNPERVTCTCCGEDYSISSDETLEKLTKYYRETYDDDPNPSLEQYLGQNYVLVIKKDDVTEDEKRGTVPVQGYVRND